MRETWYVLVDGNAVHPSEVSVNDKGELVHKSGVAVEMRDETPRSRGVEVDVAKPFGGKGDHDGNGSAGGAAPAAKPKDMHAEKPAQGYKTRQTRTRR
jgi:hypothetical protein